MTIPAHYVRKLNLKNDTINLTHGAGGLATAQLIEEVFAKHLTNTWLDEGHDGALLPPITHPVAVSCDAHVVTPLFSRAGISGAWLWQEPSTMWLCAAPNPFTLPQPLFWKKVSRFRC